MRPVSATVATLECAIISYGSCVILEDFYCSLYQRLNNWLIAWRKICPCLHMKSWDFKWGFYVAMNFYLTRVLLVSVRWTTSYIIEWGVFEAIRNRCECFSLHYCFLFVGGCCTYHVHRTPSTLMCTRTYFYIVYGPYKLVTSFTMMHCALNELSAHEVMYLLRESL